MTVAELIELLDEYGGHEQVRIYVTDAWGDTGYQPLEKSAIWRNPNTGGVEIG